ncbi:DEAD/DEAH box helicase [Ancylostoma caninum]|uniref:RNA helicase n=1 Tax=Ancylostoma caninum TaxID=29170 RepID=A0A368FV73_ANCCA|nr:DEAD/DEAH box helicase [Ancylostoma caninum]
MGRDKKKREEVVDAELTTETAPLPSKKSRRRVRIADDLPESSAGASSSAPFESRKAAVAEVECETQGGRKRKRLRKNKHKHQLENFKKAKLNVVEPEVGTKTFSDFDIDERILKAIGNLGWKWPTQVQESMFTLALEDKNIMARARTGSGKTGAYLIPIIHKCIAYSSDPGEPRGPSALFIAPTKELCVQINELLLKLLHPLPFLRCLNLSDLNSDERSVWEHDFANFVVSTPGKILEMLSARPEFCSDVRHLVLDEADLLLSFGYEEEMNTLKKHLPPSYQCILTSATITDDMSELKSLFITGSVFTIKLKEGDLPDVDQLTQYQITCLDDNERFAILVSMFKLRLIVGKTIIFVNDTNRCYLTSLVLRAFGLKSCILNSSMPANSRFHVINQYNNGACDIVIASDAIDAFGSDAVQPKEPARRDKEAGVSRGIDFHQVGNVVNLDFPTSTDNYIHRVGRTARGRNKGTALSFCTPAERPYLDAVQEDINTQMGRKVIIPYEIRIKELDSFLLRVKEVLSKCGKSVIKAARIQEIKLEIMRSAKLQSFFANNPREKTLMETTTRPTTVAVHTTAIADVPDYMVPKSLRGINFSVGSKKKVKPGQRHRRKLQGKSTNQKIYNRKKNDPLTNFKI